MFFSCPSLVDRIIIIYYNNDDDDDNNKRFNKNLISIEEHSSETFSFIHYVKHILSYTILLPKMVDKAGNIIFTN